MKMCQKHWDKLREEIIKLGLGDFISKDGKEVARRLVIEASGDRSVDNYDPLMGAHNMIFGNAMDLIPKLGGNPLEMLCENKEHPERECPICYLNWMSEEHDKICTNPDCPKEKGKTFDIWIEKAAQGSKEYLDSLVTT